ncbi:MAG: hypothetical protein O3A00_25455 [Planctomycetota bacterium]|nr:hypothetical protein [Planctomycetota bacterium]
MPRKRELTYQKGSGGRVGRWRKKYRGVVYYFPAGSGKTDLTAYEQAMERWSQKKTEIDAQVVKPYEDDYRTAIIEWNAVLNWSTQHGDHSHAQLARRKVKGLQARQCISNPEPLAHGDRLAEMFELPAATRQAIVDAAMNVGNIDFTNLELPTGSLSSITPNQQFPDELMTSWGMQARIWQDRIDSQLLIQSEPQSATVEGTASQTRSASIPQLGKFAPSTEKFLKGEFADSNGWNSRLFKAACDLKAREVKIEKATELLLRGAQPRTAADKQMALETIQSAYVKPRTQSAF